MRRLVRVELWSYLEHTLANEEVAEYGHLACIDLSTGLVVTGQTDTNLLPFGTFEEDMVGNGERKVRVKLFREKALARWVNDAAPNDVTSADIGKLVYVRDSQTVSTLATGRSVAGRAWLVDGSRVLVEMADTLGVPGSAGA